MQSSSGRSGNRLLASVSIALVLLGLASIASAAPEPPERPNFLFIVLDDVGMDQMKVFGYGGATAPRNYWANVTGQKSSWYDFNLDGLTNQNDVPYITSGKFPRKCPKAKPH